MKTLDLSKALLLKNEFQFFKNEFIEKLAEDILDQLVHQTNEKIFIPKNGLLKCNIPVGNSPNAKAIYSAKSFNPTIEINLAMLIAIYKDAFTFPIISERIALETEAIKVLNNTESLFKGKSYTFDEGIPKISENDISGAIKQYCTFMTQTVEKDSDSKFSRNEIYCRFLMFELMLTWTFFHELGHILQQHEIFKLPKNKEDIDSIEISEIEDSGGACTDINRQAREILADAEGLDLTLKYLARSNKISIASVYLLLCSTKCMTQRFYFSGINYSENLTLNTGTHPHPALRDEFAKGFAFYWFEKYKNLQDISRIFNEIANAYKYLEKRASLTTIRFKSHRVEKSDGIESPSYLKIYTEKHREEWNSCVSILIAAIKVQAPQIKVAHLLKENNPIDFILDSLQGFK